MSPARQTTAVALVLSAVLAGPAPAGAAFVLDFSSDQLPSAQGLTYFGNVSETSTFSVSGGVLHMDTVQYTTDFYAVYEQLNTFSHTMNAELVADVKVTQVSKGFGISLGFSDSVVSTSVIVTPTGWSIYGRSASGTFADRAAFHLIDLKWSADTSTYTLSVDGTQVATGSALGGSGTTPTIDFGDATPTGGNMIADFKSIGYSTSDPNAVSVPTPPGLVLAATAGLAGLTGSLVRRTRRVLGVATAVRG